MATKKTVQTAPATKGAAKTTAAKGATSAPAKTSTRGRRPSRPAPPLAVTSVGGFAVVIKRESPLSPEEKKKLKEAIDILYAFEVLSVCQRPSE